MDDAAKHTVIPEILWLVMTSWLFYGNWAYIEMLPFSKRILWQKAIKTRRFCLLVCTSSVSTDYRLARPKAGLVYSEHLGLTNSCEVSYLAADRHVLKKTLPHMLPYHKQQKQWQTQQLGACKFWWMFFPIWQLYVRIVYACCGFNCLWFGLQSLANRCTPVQDMSHWFSISGHAGWHDNAQLHSWVYSLHKQWR